MQKQLYFSIILFVSMMGGFLVEGSTLKTKNSEVIKLLNLEKSFLNNIPYSRLRQIGKSSAVNNLLFWQGSSNTFKYTDERISKMPEPSGGKEWQCISEASYFEARGESVKGQFAVAEVILNRVDSKRFPNSICKVVAQGTKKGRRHNCQFSYNCDGLTERIRNKAAYSVSKKVANIMMGNEPRSITYGALYYHAKFVRPKWSRNLKRTATIGLHHFYIDN